MQSTLLRYQSEILAALRHAVQQASEASALPGEAGLISYYGQMQYHLGWVDSHFSPVPVNPGKLLRPTLLLLAFEAAGACNTGDGMFALARLALWGILDEGVEARIAVRLGALLDQTCLEISEGQYLDISFESRQDIAVSMYMDMIGRKTATLMGCAAQMGAILGTHDQETIDRLHSFGYAIGIAFQVRDDILGIWASTQETGKSAAGDIYRRKKSLPVLHAIEHANLHDQQFLQQVYGQASPVTSEQAEEVLAIFARTETQAYCRAFLAKQCRLAHEALAHVPQHANPVAARALDDMETLVHFVEGTSC